MYILWRAVEWIVLIIATLIALDWVGVPQQVVTWALVGAGFGAMAYAAKSPYWQYLRHKNVNPFSKQFGLSSFPKPPAPKRITIAQRLNTPFKRVSLVVFIAGLLVCVITFATFRLNYNYTNRFFDAMFNATWRYHDYRHVFFAAAILMCLGYLCAFHYPKVLGLPIKWLSKLFGWIRHGNEKNS